MKKLNIKTKLFAFTSLLLICLLAFQLIFQSLFLEGFYTYQKKNILKKELGSLQQVVAKEQPIYVNDTLQKFSRKFEVAVGIMSFYGAPLYGFEVGQASIEVLGEDDVLYKVPLEGVIENKVFKEALEEGEYLTIYGIKSKVRDNELYPHQIEIGEERFDVVRKENSIPMEETIVIENNMTSSIASEITYRDSIGEQVSVKGTIQSIYIPSQHVYRNEYRQNKLLQEGSAFLQEIVTAGKNLKVGEVHAFERLDTLVGMKNMVGVVPFYLRGEPVLLIAMMSFEQIAEATNIMIQYTILIFIFIASIALGIAYWYAKRLTKPLVELRDVTSQLTRLNFDQSCHVSSEDEIGELAMHINTMSYKLKETLDAINKDLQAKEKLNEERKQFIADASHELKTPLTVIKGTCEGMLRGMYDVNNPSYIETMLYHVNDMSELVHELLEASRLEKEEVLTKVPFNLKDVFLKIHHKLKSVARTKGIQVEMDLEEAFVIGDEKKIERVIRNLYMNALVYTRNKCKVLVTIHEQEDGLRLSIENKGAHIDVYHLDRIWEPFYRIEVSRNKALGGSGLGLYMVKQILEKHHAPYGIGNTKEGVEVWFILKRYRDESDKLP